MIIISNLESERSIPKATPQQTNTMLLMNQYSLKAQTVEDMIANWDEFNGKAMKNTGDGDDDDDDGDDDDDDDDDHDDDDDDDDDGDDDDDDDE